MRLTSGPLTLEIEEERGRIIAIDHRSVEMSLVRERRLAENWRLLVPLPGWRGHYIIGSEQRLSRLEPSPDGSGVTLTWSQLRSTQGEFDITVQLGIQLDGDDIRFGLSLENRSGATIEEAIFPALGGMANPMERERWLLHHPTVGGIGHEWRAFDEFPGTYLGPAAPVWTASYPGQMSMPWLDIYDPSRRRGVMLANLDPRPEAAFSMAYAQLKPCTGRRGSAQLWPRPEEAGEEPVGMTLAWACFPFLRPGATWESPPVVLHFHRGTWYAAADHYRAWFDRTMPWPVDKKDSWLAGQDAWQSTIISYPEGSVGYRFQDLPRLAAAARSAGINVLQIDGWDVGGIDRDYPIYQPDPRLGSADELRGAIAACREQGVEVLLFGNLQWAHLETDWWREELHRYAARDPFGHVRNSMGWEYHTLLGLAGQCTPRMVAMNPAHPEFDRIIRSQLLSAARLGPGGMQIDKLLGALGIDYEPSLTGPRDQSMTASVLRTLRAFLEEARAGNPGFCLAAECHWDRTIPFVDASYSRFFSDEHIPTTGRTFPEYRQSCCITGHWDRGLVNNCLRYGHVINIEARCLHGSAADAPELAAYVREVLALRRSLRPVLWESRLAEPLALELDADPEVRSNLHESCQGKGAALVLNHFSRRARKARLAAWEGVAEVQVHRPGTAPRRAPLPLELELAPDEVAVLVRDP